MRPDPKPQEIYKHFKGNIYQIVTLARHSETGMKMVVYQQLYAPFEVYVRPLEMFMSRIDTRKYPNEQQTYRFERLDRWDAQGEEDSKADMDWKESATSGKAPDVSGRESATSRSAPDVSGKTSDVSGKASDIAEEFTLDPGLVEFLDADSYEKKLQILSMLHPRITDSMIDTMAVSLDTEVKEGDIETRYNEIKGCLITMERFECNRLR